MIVLPERSLPEQRSKPSASYFVENLNAVVWWNFSPGFKSVFGKSG
jgi:hypothetical protein